MEGFASETEFLVHQHPFYETSDQQVEVARVTNPEDAKRLAVSKAVTQSVSNAYLGISFIRRPDWGLVSTVVQLYKPLLEFSEKQARLAFDRIRRGELTSIVGIRRIKVDQLNRVSIVHEDGRTDCISMVDTLVFLKDQTLCNLSESAHLIDAKSIGTVVDEEGRFEIRGENPFFVAQCFTCKQRRIWKKENCFTCTVCGRVSHVLA